MFTKTEGNAQSFICTQLFAVKLTNQNKEYILAFTVVSKQGNCAMIDRIGKIDHIKVQWVRTNQADVHDFAEKHVDAVGPFCQVIREPL